MISELLTRLRGIEPTRDQCERQRPGWWIGTVLQDVRYALRGFRRNPLFTMSVLVTLALGIGATTAVFSVVDRILFRPLPYADPSRIVSVGMVHSLEHVPTETIRLGSAYGNGRNRMRSTTLNTAVVAPMPSASVTRTLIVKSGLRRNPRSA